MNFGTPPQDLRAVAPYLARATELRKKEPIMAYYCQSNSYSLPAHHPLPGPVDSLGPREDCHDPLSNGVWIDGVHRPLLCHTSRHNNQNHSEGVQNILSQPHDFSRGRMCYLTCSTSNLIWLTIRVSSTRS